MAQDHGNNMLRVGHESGCDERQRPDLIDEPSLSESPSHDPRIDKPSIPPLDEGECSALDRDRPGPGRTRPEAEGMSWATRQTRVWDGPAGLGGHLVERDILECDHDPEGISSEEEEEEEEEGCLQSLDAADNPHKAEDPLPHGSMGTSVVT